MADFKTVPDIKAEALHIVGRNLLSWKRDITRDMNDLSYLVSEGCASRGDSAELDLMRSELSILVEFEQILDRISADLYKGV